MQFLWQNCIKKYNNIFFNIYFHFQLNHLRIAIFCLISLVDDANFGDLGLTAVGHICATGDDYVKLSDDSSNTMTKHI